MQEIFETYYEKIYYWAIKKTNSIEDAQDLTNNVFLSIFEYVNKNIKIEKLDNLIWKIANNLWNQQAKMYIDEKNNTNTIEDYNTKYEEEYIGKIIYKEIIENMNDYGLTPNELICFKDYYYKDLSIKEIAEEINSTESNIKYYLYNARKKIKERYYD